MNFYVVFFTLKSCWSNCFQMNFLRCYNIFYLNDLIEYAFDNFKNFSDYSLNW